MKRAKELDIKTIPIDQTRNQKKTTTKTNIAKATEVL